MLLGYLRCGQILEKIIILDGLLDQGSCVKILLDLTTTLIIPDSPHPPLITDLIDVDVVCHGDALARHALLLVESHLARHAVAVLRLRVQNNKCFIRLLS